MLLHQRSLIERTGGDSIAAAIQSLDEDGFIAVARSIQGSFTLDKALRRLSVR